MKNEVKEERKIFLIY